MQSGEVGPGLVNTHAVPADQWELAAQPISGEAKSGTCRPVSGLAPGKQGRGVHVSLVGREVLPSGLPGTQWVRFLTSLLQDHRALQGGSGGPRAELRRQHCSL